VTIHWILCGSESLHILGTCPNCYATESGLLMGTTVTGYAGRITVTCVDCGKSVDYYVDAAVQKVWKLDPVESKRVSSE
jgi:transcription elongation factor Elf1